MRSKVTVVGAGNVGATTAQRVHQLGYADVVLVDVVEDLPQGKSLDMLESGPVLGSDAAITGSNGYEETSGSDVVVITAGIARRPGMSRDDLLLTNMRITSSVTEQVVKHSPNSIIIPVTNPLDAMVQNVYEASGFPRNRVFGMAGVLDTARFRTFIAQELDVSVEDVQAYVLGGHGDDMVPLVRFTTVGGIPISELMAEEKVDQLVRRTRQGGGEIVALLKEGSAYYAPSAAITQMVEAVLLDKKRILPCCAYLEGEYGINGLCVGVPVKLGAGGMEQILEINLTAEEKAALQSSADSVKELVEVMNEARNRGVGTSLIPRVCPHPWSCRDCGTGTGSSQLALVALGASVGQVAQTARLRTISDNLRRVALALLAVCTWPSRLAIAIPTPFILIETDDWLFQR